MKNFKTPLAAALDFFLKISGTTQKELAWEVGYSNANSISAVLAERTGGTEVKRRAIAEFFGCDYEEFLAIGQHILNTKNDSGIPSLSLPSIEKIIREKLKTKIEATPQHERHKKGEKSVCDINEEADRRHAMVIRDFEDREWALEINKMLVEIEKYTPAQKDAVMAMVKGLHSAIPVSVKKTGTH